jgi:DNA damage-binding protein 1
MIVTALAKTVVLWKLKYHSQARPELEKRCTYRSATLPIEIECKGKRIAVTDLMKSLTVIQYQPGTTGMSGADPDALVEVARDHATAWATSVSEVEPDTWLQGDADGNLQVLSRDTSGVTDLDQKKLTVTSEMHISEMVNRIKAIDVKVQPNSAVIPRAFVATVSKSLFLLGR